MSSAGEAIDNRSEDKGDNAGDGVGGELFGFKAFTATSVAGSAKIRLPGDSARRSSNGDFTIEGEFSVGKNHEESDGPELAAAAAEIVDIGDAGTSDPTFRAGDCPEEPVFCTRKLPEPIGA